MSNCFETNRTTSRDFFASMTVFQARLFYSLKYFFLLYNQVWLWKKLKWRIDILNEFTNSSQKCYLLFACSQSYRSWGRKWNKKHVSYCPNANACIVDGKLRDKWANLFFSCLQMFSLAECQIFGRQQPIRIWEKN